MRLWRKIRARWAEDALAEEMRAHRGGIDRLDPRVAGDGVNRVGDVRGDVVSGEPTIEGDRDPDGARGAARGRGG